MEWPEIRRQRIRQFHRNVLEIREDLQQPENILVTLLSLIRSVRATKRLMTALRGETYFNERPRGRSREFLARREQSSEGELVERPAVEQTGGRDPAGQTGPDTLTFLPVQQE